MNAQKLAAAGFQVFETGGGCVALARDLPDGRKVLVSDFDGGIDFDRGDWAVSLYNEMTGETVQEYYLTDREWFKFGKRTSIEAAIAACGINLEGAQ